MLGTPCSIDNECSTMTSENGCTLGKCVNKLCVAEYAVSGTSAIINAQTSGDCQILQCDGAGGVTSVSDNTDPPSGSTICRVFFKL